MKLRIQKEELKQEAMNFKFTNQDYEEFDLFAGDMDVDTKCHSQKIVKTRVPHMCWDCQTEHPKGTFMVRERAIVEDEGWKSTYVCIPCMDKLLTECGYEPKENNGT